MGKRDVIDLGASSAHRWTVCTASPKFIVQNADKLPEDTTVWAEEGTQAHEIAALLLQGLGVQPGTAQEMLFHVEKYVNHVKSHQTPASVVVIEKRVPLYYMAGRNGIVDAATYNSDAIYIDDLKYGMGVSVDAFENKQLAIYAESMIRQWEKITKFEPDFPVHLSIIQPRDRNNPEPVRTWSLTRKELAMFATTIGAKAWSAMNSDGEFVPHADACKFCPAKGICSAYATQGLVALPETARIIELPHVGSLTREQRVQALRAKKVLIEWLEAVQSQETAELLAGAEPQGFKLVEGKANRTWVDDEAAMKLLNNHLTIDELRPRSDLISPAQAEKALKGIELSTKFQNKLKSFITRPEGKPTLVPEDDKRPALTINKSPEFDNLDII